MNADITQKQIKLIEAMNEFCNEKFDLENNKSKKDAIEYIARNMDEFKLKQMDNWQLKYM